MDLVEFIDLFIGALLNVMFSAIIIRKVFKVEMTKNKRVKYTSLLLTTLLICIINIFNKDVFKALITIPVFAVGMKYIFNIKLQKSILYELTVTFYLIIGELIVGIVFSMLPVDYLYTVSKVLGRTFGNVAVIVITTPFLYVTIIRKIFVKLFDNERVNNKNIGIAVILSLLLVSALMYKNTRGVQDALSTVMNAIICIGFIIVVYISYKENQKSEKISQNYNVLLTYLEKYEKEIVDKRKIIHEYKNQLIVINGYIGNDNKLREYVKEIIEEQKGITDSDIIKNIDKLPSGLKGLIYYKFSQLDNKVKVDMDVGKGLDKFDKIPTKVTKDILKIVGILIDNSIEEAIKSKDKYVSMEFSIVNSSFKMVLFNSCKGTVDTKKIMDAGFSTKGKNRGYGLSLVKDIIKKDDNFELEIDTESKGFKAIFTVKI